LKEKIFQYKYPLAIFFVLLTIVLSLWPDLHPEHFLHMHYHWQLDVAFHGSWYFVLTTILLYLRPFKVKPLLLCSIILLCSFLLEVTQLWVHGRSYSYMDMGSNVLGISLGLIGLAFCGERVVENKKESIT
jgi:VanZ family protein